MIQLKCKKHPRYNGQSSPRASCAHCMWIWEIATEHADMTIRPKVKTKTAEPFVSRVSS